MGVACATLPTSSSFCMIFFMRAFLSAKGLMIGLCFSKVLPDAGNWGRTTGNLVCLFLFFMTDVRGWDLTVVEPEKLGAWDVCRESQSQVISHRLNSNNNCCTYHIPFMPFHLLDGQVDKSSVIRVPHLSQDITYMPSRRTSLGSRILSSTSPPSIPSRVCTYLQ
jgi:hypothetical protein